MLPKHSYDVIVIGAGSAGLSAVEAARSLGASVCLVEKGRLGGGYSNHVDVPSKALLRAAKFYRSLQDAKRFGVTIGSSSFQFADVMRYRDTVVDQITGGGTLGDRYVSKLKELDVDVRQGTARFEDAQFISVDGQSLHGKAIVVATGTVEDVPEIPGLGAIYFLTSKDAFSKTRPLKSVAIIGGDSVACEIATFFATFGTRVVLLQKNAHILSSEDEECSVIAEKQMRKMGIEIVTDAVITEIVDGRGGVYGVKVNVHGIPSMHAVEQVVLAEEKRFDDASLGLEALGVKLNERGFIKTSKAQETSVPNIFSAGAANSERTFVNVACLEGAAAGFNAARFALGKRMPKHIVDERIVPHVTFTAPEMASVGSNAEEIKKRYGQVSVGRCSFSELPRSIMDSEPIGLIKLVAHPKTHKILGGQVIGAHAGEIIHEMALAIQLNATSEKLASMIHAHPTYAEGVCRAASQMKTE